MVQIIPRVILTFPSTISEMVIVHVICHLFVLLHTFSSNGHQFDTLAGDEIKGFVDIGNFVKPKMVQE